MNTRLLLNCLDGVSETDALQRLNDRTNSLSFIACHLVDSRHFLAGYLGLEEENPFQELLRDVNAIEDVTTLPGLSEIREAWQSIGHALDACFRTLDEEDLTAASPQRFPLDDPTLLGGIAFLAQHESYHIGQLALVRKYPGYSAMRYG